MTKCAISLVSRAKSFRSTSQFTLYKHHESLVPMSAFNDSATTTFAEYEKFMEAMLVLYGDSLAEPDLEKVSAVAQRHA